MNHPFSILGCVFAFMGWAYAFVLIVVDRVIDDSTDGSFDAILEAFVSFFSPKFLFAQCVGVVSLYMVGSNIFGWIVKGGV